MPSAAPARPNRGDLPTPMNSYCVFNVGERRVGIPLAHVREIIEHSHLEPTPIPLTPPCVHGLFNLRGQVLPFLDLTPFIGAQPTTANVNAAPAIPTTATRALIVERGKFRFATTGRRIDTIEADPAKFTPLPDAALHPALEAEAHTDYGRFHIIHLDRLEACLIQTLRQTGAATTAPVAPVPSAPDAPSATSAPTAAAPGAPDEPSATKQISKHR